jgi:hypothetical protein
VVDDGADAIARRTEPATGDVGPRRAARVGGDPPDTQLDEQSIGRGLEP